MTGTVSLIGEVIEVFEKDGKRVAKISLKPSHIEVEADLLQDAHLGDTVILEANISIKSVEPYSSDRTAGLTGCLD